MSETNEFTVGVASYSGTNCLCQSISNSKTADEYEAKDESGITKAYVVTNKKENVTLELIIGSAYEEPEIGETITIGDSTYYVQSVTVTESNTDFKKASVAAIRYVDGALPAASSSSGL